VTRGYGADADAMSLDLFAGLPVTRYAPSVGWYEQLLGSSPSFLPNPTEAVWELAEHRFVYVVEQPERAGRGVVTLFVDDLDERLSAIAARGIEPARSEAYDNGVRKVSFVDPDGNEVALAGGPAGS
jgi:catechol 2,3-dioxygenase-like lactoylglutathione lyase family enzyme